MTYGIQNTLEEGVALLDKAFDDYGINFLDTAEIYPIPPNGDNQGDTDRCVCEFLKNREGVALLDTAFDDYGINFLDTAEIYPIPPNGDNQGDTDRCVCEFLKNRDRKDVILATKVAGRSPMLTYLPR